MSREPVEFSSDDLVSEQSGLRWIAIAVGISLVFGLLFRSTYSPERLGEILQRASEQLPKSTQVNFRVARLSLADGLLPDFSIVIEELKLSSTDECLGQPQLEVSEVRLPVSIRDLLRGQLKFDRAELDAVDLAFLSNLKKCLRDNSSSVSGSPQTRSGTPSAAATSGVTSPGAESGGDEVPESATSAPTPVHAPSPTRAESHVQAHSQGHSQAQAPTQAQAEAGSTEANPDSSHLTLMPSELSVFVRSLRIALPDEAQTTLLFERAALTPDGAGNHSIEGTLRLSRDSFLSESSSKANIKANYHAGPMKLEYSIDGNWREGAYRAKGEYKIKEQNFSIQGTVQNLPITSMLPLLQRYKFLDREFGVEKVWLSAEFSTLSEKEKAKGELFEIRKLSVDGDLGEVEIPQIRILSWFPLRAAPVDMQLRGLKVDSLLSLLRLNANSDMLGSLGFFNGKVHMSSTSDIHLEGEHSGLEFVFSNRGQRRNQVISLMTGKADFVQNRWIFRIDSVRPLDGIFFGQIIVHYLPEQSQMNVEMQFDELSLSPDVQRLMTSGGALGNWSGAVNFEIRGQRLRAMTGELDLSGTSIEGVVLDKSKLTLRSRGETLILDFKAREAVLNEGLVADWLKAFHSFEIPAKAPGLGLRLEVSIPDSLKWRLSPILSQNVTLSSDGFWDAKNEVNGSIQVKFKSAPTKSWKISGSRSAPVIEPN